MDLVTGRRNRVPISQLIRRTLRDLEPHARELGSERELEGIAEILARGNGAEEQLRVWNANRDISEVVRSSPPPRRPASDLAPVVLAELGAQGVADLADRAVRTQRLAHRRQQIDARVARCGAHGVERP